MKRPTPRWRRPALLSLGALAFLFVVAASAQASLVADGPGGRITVLSPAQDGLETNAAVLTVTGVVSHGASYLGLVEANGMPVTVWPTGSFSVPVPLVEGVNVIRITSRLSGGERTELGFLVTRDQQAPPLEVFVPSEGAVLPGDRTLVLGLAERGSAVTVNGKPVAVNAFDGSFELRELTLSLGGAGCVQPGTLTINARDSAGNVATVVRSVTANRCVTHPTLAAPLPAVLVGQGQVDPLAIDFARYFDDDAGRSGLTFEVSVGGTASSALSASYAPGSLSLSWSAPFTGEAQLFVTARDGDGEASDPAPLTLTVSAAPPANRPPVLTLASAVEPLPIGGAISFSLTAVDPDGDAVSLFTGALTPGLRVVSIEQVDGEHYTVTVAADAAAGESAARIVLTGADARLAPAQLPVTFSVYDASGPAGLALAEPALPEVAPSAFVVGPLGARGLYVEVSALRRVGHLYLADPRLPGAAFEVPPLNDEHTYWRFFAPVPGVAGTYSTTVWTLDPGFAPEPFTFTLTVVDEAGAPAIERVVALGGDFSTEEGAPVRLAFVGVLPTPEATRLEWRVDGELVGVGPTLEGAVLDVGEHAVTLTAEGPGGSSSASATLTVRSKASPAVAPGTTPWLLYFSLIGLIAVGFVLGGTEIGLYFLFAGLLGAIIDRENREKLLTHFVRGRIYQIIEYEPGIHLSELQRKAGVARGVCAYHLHALEKAGLVRAARDGMFLRFTATKVKIDADAYALAAEDREVLKAIEARPGITEREVGEILGKTGAQVSRSVKVLAQSGYVEAKREGEAMQLFARTTRGDPGNLLGQ